jgi:hypothetical protein
LTKHDSRQSQFFTLAAPGGFLVIFASVFGGSPDSLAKAPAPGLM